MASQDRALPVAPAPPTVDPQAAARHSYYEEEYFEEIGRQELIAQTLKDISEEGIRKYLGTYGDAVESRINDVFWQATYASQQGYPRFAVVGAVTAIELIVRYMLVRPLLQGAFLSDNWAQLLTQRITAGKTVQERDILPSMLEVYDIKLKDIELSDGSKLWKTITEKIIRKRNSIVHDGESAMPAEGKIALECVKMLREQIVLPIADIMGFTLEATGCWHKIENSGRDNYEQSDPFGAE
jgi:hypothetical protein